MTRGRARSSVEPASVLVLAGTGDARAVIEALIEIPAIRVVASRAGATTDAAPYPCETRVGGFGGPEGLAEWVRAAGVSAVIDATHPFAATMSAHARAACDAVGAPLIGLVRPSWRQEVPRAAWTVSVAEAAAGPPSGARVFAAIGSRSLGPFAARTDLTVIARALEPPPADIAARCEMIYGPPATDAAAEGALFQRLGVTDLAAKDAGGAWGVAKLRAAAKLDLRVWMIARPAAPRPDIRVETADQAVAALQETLAARSVAPTAPSHAVRSTP